MEKTKQGERKKGKEEEKRKEEGKKGGNKPLSCNIKRLQATEKCSGKKNNQKNSRENK